MTCHNSALSAAKSRNSDGLEEVDFETALRKVKRGVVEYVKIQGGDNEGVCSCVNICVLYIQPNAFVMSHCLRRNKLL